MSSRKLRKTITAKKDRKLINISPPRIGPTQNPPNPNLTKKRRKLPFQEPSQNRASARP